MRLGWPSGLNLQSETREGRPTGRGGEPPVGWQGCVHRQTCDRLGEGSWHLAELEGEVSLPSRSAPGKPARLTLGGRTASSGGSRLHLLSAANSNRQIPGRRSLD